MREKFIEFLKSKDLNIIAIELYEYFNENGNIKLDLDTFLNLFGQYITAGGNINKYIEFEMTKFKINTISKNNQIINYY